MRTSIRWTRMSTWVCTGFIILLGVAMVSATVSARAALTAPAFVPPPLDEFGHVTVSVYSGRPNPTWALSSEEHANIQTTVPTLPLTSTQVMGGGLGYQGFVVELRDPITQSMTTMTVFNGVIESTTPNSREVRQDEGRAFERWLLEHAKPHLEIPLYDILAQELLG